MSSGWPAHRVEDYVAQSTAFESQLLSFLAEGVFQKFPALRLVLLESGFTWLPNLLWRTSKTWRGVRPEVPWIDRAPAEIIREHVRVTLQPVDAPAGDPDVARSARWSTSVPTACCCSRPTIRTGISTATTCCRTGLSGDDPAVDDDNALPIRTIRWRPIRRFAGGGANRR